MFLNFGNESHDTDWLRVAAAESPEKGAEPTAPRANGDRIMSDRRRRLIIPTEDVATGSLGSGRVPKFVRRSGRAPSADLDHGAEGAGKGVVVCECP